MATNFSLTAEGVENHHFSALGGQFPSKFDTVICKISLYEGMVNNTCDTEENGTNSHDVMMMWLPILV